MPRPSRRAEATRARRAQTPSASAPHDATIRHRSDRLRTARVAAVSLAVVAAVAFFYLTAADAGVGYALRGMPLDDAWIHMVYARSIAAGTPFQYNPGEWETGSTSPLWALLLSPAFVIGLPPVAWAKLLDVLLTAAAAVTGYRVAERLGDRLAGFAFAVALPLVPYLSFASVSGTEVPLFIFLVLLTAERAVAGSWTTAGAVAGFAILARPEGYLLLPLLGAGLAWTLWRERNADASFPGRLLRQGGLAATACLGVNAAWIAYCLAATGRPLPSTFYVKSGWLGLFNTEQFRKIGSFLMAQPFSGASFEAVPLVLAGVLAGGVLFVAGLRRLARANAAAFLLVGLFAPIFYYALSTELGLGNVRSAATPGSVMNYYYARYLLPGIAPMVLTCLLGLTHLTGFFRPDPVQSRAKVKGREPAAPSTGWIVAAAFLLLPAASALNQQGILRRTYSWNCQNIEELEVVAGRWIGANLPPDAVVAVSDAGACRFFGQRRVVDLVGLNSHRLIPLLAEINRTEKRSPEEAKLRDEFFRRERVDYLATIKGWHARLLRDRRVELLKAFQLERNTICGGSELSIGKLVGKNELGAEAPDTSGVPAPSR